MTIFDDVIKGNIKEHNSSWQQIPDHLLTILITRGSVSRKTNQLLNLTSHQTDIDKIYLNAKDLYKAKYQLLINKRKKEKPKAFKANFENSNDMYYIYESIEE